MEPTILSVSALTRKIKLLLEESFPALWVEGEISNYRPHHSGHFYFTLKDAEAQISCVMWRSRASVLEFTIKDGIKVRVFGNLRLYEKAGRYQIDILSLQPAGLGALQLLFEQLKQKLKGEGLFDSKYKKEIPKYPSRIGVITSPTGAAIEDIISVFSRRSPSVEILVHGVKVQGEGAAEVISQAIYTLNEYENIDTIILGRGGGSLEDLWPFNEEKVARAIFASKIPIISAVGHEIDFTIADFVADLRAPTPSAAAEIAAPDEYELKNQLRYILKSMNSLVSEKIDNFKTDIQNIARSYAFRRPEDIIHQNIIRIDELTHRMFLASSNCIDSNKEYIRKLQRQLKTLNPDNVLNRGYAMLFKEGELIRSITSVEIEDMISMKLKDGNLNGRIIGKSHD